MIRTLRDDEPIPSSEPARYINGAGYVRLRWWVGPEEYVEQYEHRIVADRPPRHLDVHHLDGNKANNDRANLVVLTKDAHTRLHAVLAGHLRRPRVRRHTTWRSDRDEARAQRRIARARATAERIDRCLTLYARGLTLVEVGEEIGLHHSGVVRILQDAGVSARTKMDYARLVDTDDVATRYRDGQGATRIARELHVDLKRVHVALAEAGIPLRGPGRVPVAASRAPTVTPCTMPGAGSATQRHHQEEPTA